MRSSSPIDQPDPNIAAPAQPESDLDRPDPDDKSTRDAPRGKEGVPWGIGEALWVLLVGIFAVFVLGVAIVLAVREVSTTLASQLSLPLSVLPIALVTLAYVRIRHPEQGLRRLFGDRRATGADIGIGLLTGVVGFFVVNIGFSLLLEWLATRMGTELPTVQEGLQSTARDPQLLPVFLLTTVVLAPVCEELFYRGMLFQALHKRLYRWPAIGLSALVFGLVHVELIAILGTFAFGLLLAWVLARRRVLASSIAAHFAFNLITSVFIVLGNVSGNVSG